MSHIGFGPAEERDAWLSVQLWPDARGFVRRALARMLEAEDDSVDDPEAFARNSIAVRGLTALERLLFDDPAPALEGYVCRLAPAIAVDVDALADALVVDWTTFGPTLAAADGSVAAIGGPEDAARALFTSFDVGMEFPSDQKLGGPIGDIARPRPERAEWRRSGLSKSAAEASLAASRDLYATTFRPTSDPSVVEDLIARFDAASEALARVAGPFDAVVGVPRSRIVLEAAHTRLRELRHAASTAIAERLGLQVGFNSLDGD